uniref:LRRCT domain-containing protein n=1 Tax=Leptobrachium leishanense TaxID=445787 RepID=A0A8C5N5F9_9ANUR
SEPLSTVAASLALIILCGSAALAGATCLNNNKDPVICDSLDYEGESGIQSIVFILSNTEVLRPTSFTNPKLKSVKSLTLGGNRIRRIEPGSFLGFPALTSLLISNNDLQTVQPSWFYNATGLEVLNVTSSKIQAMEPQMLAGFSALKVLNFKNNSISEVRSESFRDLFGLSHLDLSFNKISHLDRSALSRLQNATFRLDGNPWNCSCALREFSHFLQGI